MVRCELNVHKNELQEVLGYADQVKGFDESQSMFDDSIDCIDIYAEFLGQEEFLKAKEQYEKTLSTMH